MRNEEAPDLTRLLAAGSDGDAGALDRLVDLVYPSFRGLLRRLGLLP